MENRKYQICTKTIMDTSDSNIKFDEDGISDYYHNFHKNILPNWKTDVNGSIEILKIADEIRKAGKGKSFDCIIGISGGMDSSYAAYIAKEKLGLKPLLFHVDAGWNTHHAVENIERLVDKLNLELYTDVINWEEMKSLHRSFLKSQVPDQDVQDIAFFSALYQFSKKHKVKHVLTGSNISTECVREPEAWGAYVGIDKMLINDIHRRFGEQPLKTLPMVDILSYKIYYKYLLGMQVVKPLDYFPYIKADVERELEQRFGWQRFQHKHHESRFTRFLESYWLPQKFGADRRRAHFSSLILTGQMTREEALAKVAKPELDAVFLEQEFEYVAHKLDFTVEELRTLFNGENKKCTDYKNKRDIIRFGTKAMQFLGIEKRVFR
jgi:N-acetyl sugar amidotransferase